MTETPQPEIDRPVVVVEKWQLEDGAEFAFALCDHDPPHMQQVAESLRGNDMLLIEALGHPEEAVTEIETILSSFLDTEAADPDVIAAMIDEHEVNLSDEDYVLLAHLGGTHMKIRLIDLPEGHPEYERQIASEVAARRLDEAIAALEPVERVRELQAALLYEKAQVFTMRDDIMSGQIGSIHRENPGAKIGVILGALHFGAVQKLGQRLGISAATLESLPEKASRVAEGDPAQSCLATLLQGEEISEDALDRALLGSYGFRFDPKNYWYHASDDALNRLSAAEIRAALESIDMACKPDDYNGSTAAIYEVMNQIAVPT